MSLAGTLDASMWAMLFAIWGIYPSITKICQINLGVCRFIGYRFIGFWFIYSRHLVEATSPTSSTDLIRRLWNGAALLFHWFPTLTGYKPSEVCLPLGSNGPLSSNRSGESNPRTLYYLRNVLVYLTHTTQNFAHASVCTKFYMFVTNYLINYNFMKKKEISCKYLII